VADAGVVADASYGTKEFVTWGFSAAALIITCVWNALNRRHANKQARDLREATYAFTYWKDQRDPILTALRSFEGKAHEIQALTVLSDDSDELNKKIHAINYSLVAAHSALARDLTRLRSNEIEIERWPALAYGPVVAGESAWDRIQTLIESVTEMADASAARTRLKDVAPLVESIGTGLVDAISAENAAHKPHKI
jgi:hypothetical protein